MNTTVKADATGALLLPAELCRAAGVAPGADVRDCDVLTFQHVP